MEKNNEECANSVPQQLGLDAFMTKARAELDRFETYWRKMHATEPDTFPASMWEGDWYEQFRFFADSDR